MVRSRPEASDMNRIWTIPALLLLLAPAPATFAADVFFPDTAPGRHARDYFVAFQGGEEAMRAYMTAHVDRDALRERPVEDRLEVYRWLRDAHREFTPVRIDESTPHAIAVVVRTAQRELILLRFNCAATAPHGLLGLRVETLGPDEADAAAEGAPTGPPPTDSQIVAALGAELDSLAGIGAFSGAVMLDKGGKPLFARAYGMASREAKRPNAIETQFNLGSINKIFTSVAIHQLAQAGKLGLDDPIGRHLKDFPAENAKRITIRMLLNHRSGVPDVLRTPELWENPGKVRTAEDWYRLIKDQPLEFEPGTRNQYSNGGYAVLGMIVERRSGQDYYAYIREHVYRPAGMSRTESFAAEEIPADAAIGYTRESDAHGAPGSVPPRGGALQPITSRFGRPSAAGGGFSTVGDLVKFARALGTGKLLDEEGTRRVHGGGLGIAGGSPGCNALLESNGPYTLAVLANADPPAAERLVKTAGRMIQRAAGGGGVKQEIGAGGGKR